MSIIAGVDIGNATTEVALARWEDGQPPQFLATGIVETTGIKGTRQNIHGVFGALRQALKNAGLDLVDLGQVRINEAAPVIGDVAMETITETIITESTMIGHNPATPGGVGLGVGYTCELPDLNEKGRGERVIPIIPPHWDFSEAAGMIQEALDRGVEVNGAVVCKDDGVLINNRLREPIPIVDEVRLIEKVPLDMLAAVEVAAPGRVIEQLSNPFGIATVFDLSSAEAALVTPVARALIGNRSAVVIKTPQGDVRERRIPAGKLTLMGERQSLTVDVEEGAQRIMEAVAQLRPLRDVKGEPGTNVGGMLERVRQTMADLTDKLPAEVEIQDILAVDTFVPQRIHGGLADEFAMENVVGLAAMVKADRLQMDKIAAELQQELKLPVEVGGVEAEMAVQGALTTPGTDRPLAILDLGAGSSDAAVISKEGRIVSVHLAGAGNMVNMLIDAELGLGNLELAEEIKKFPLAKVESLFHIRHEDGTAQFFSEVLEAQLFARVVILKETGMVPVPADHGLEKIRSVRREAKRKVFATNAVRALEEVSITGNVRDVAFSVLLGGSSLDFEVPQMVTDRLAEFACAAGRANIRGTEGPRNAVATGLILSLPPGRGG